MDFKNKLKETLEKIWKNDNIPTEMVDCVRHSLLCVAFIVRINLSLNEVTEMGNRLIFRDEYFSFLKPNTNVNTIIYSNI